VSTDATPTILVCYDGSDRAAHAIAHTGRLFPAAAVTILNVWEPIEHIVARYAALAPYLGEQIPEADAAAAKQSTDIAEEGVALATRAGLHATAHSAAIDVTVWEAVIAAATAIGADLIVTGTRSLHGMHELLSGSLSHQLLQHSRVAVLAIPSPPEK
jgi:nucleotide-binding universal stress UspA family protein